MKAVVFPGNKVVEIREVEKPTPGYGEVLIQMKAAAICRSDMSLYYGNGQAVVGDKSVDKGGIYPGHEPAGQIVEVGQGVSSFKRGDRVAVYLALGCGQCEHCKSGYKMFCKEFKCIGFDEHGGDADYLCVPAENCMRIPDEMSYVSAAVSTDAVGTLYHAQKRLNVSARDTVVIYGLGPMGAAGVMIASALGAKVIAVDVIEERLEMARELGAVYTINSMNEDPVEQIMAITHELGATVAIDCSGNAKAENNAIDCVGPHGRVAFVGENRQLTINPSDQMIRKQIVLMGSWYFPIFEYDEISRFIVNHDLPVEKLVTHRFQLTEAAEAFKLFDERKTEKAVFVWE
ncbi:Alcohol dehydrogenase [Paenibacillus polymyxa E681]|uniref:zinc-dependent alcohol dehydrogenase family protein n=1 Tax=Paenibacillus polymyxa TaxID=1406 RepID=UPI0001E31707|nr:zinc-binding dehydrogenase [Paenibacillus polymyxa]ADM68715.1 alcohol dehydrogenase [Paenibacillus polymyxa E681]QNV55721.1 Alcohol dehydrogenase [Paenibacillus polymyxa E681]QNV60557.1 Alcohol dehydrogenase [Paenibacillus polymyxa E681]